MILLSEHLLNRGSLFYSEIGYNVLDVYMSEDNEICLLNIIKKKDNCILLREKKK